MRRSPYCYTTTPKRDKIPPKNRSLLVHILELSTAVLEVDIKVTIASVTQNLCLQCVPPTSKHTEIGLLRPCTATKLNNDSIIKFVDVHYQTEPNLSIFPKEI